MNQKTREIVKEALNRFANNYGYSPNPNARARTDEDTREFIRIATNDDEKLIREFENYYESAKVIGNE